MYTQSLTKQKYGLVVAVLGILGAMLLLPYLVHLVPAQLGVPLGARLLPIFYAPLVAVVLFDLRSAIIAALVAPILNYLIMGSPTPIMVVFLTVEIVVFSLTASFLFRRYPRLVVVGPLSYVTAVAVVASILLVRPLPALDPLTFFVSSLSNAVPGLLVLLFINILLVRYSGKNDATQG